MNGRLGSITLTAGSLTTLYQVPASIDYAAASVSIVNRHNIPGRVRMAVSNTSTPDLAEWIEYDVEIPAKGVLERTGLMLGSEQLIMVFSDIDHVNAVVMGAEITEIPVGGGGGGGGGGPEPEATYAIVADSSSVNEGESLNFTITTSGVDDGTTLFWTANNSGDFVINSGSFDINSNSGTISVTPEADETTEGIESFIVSVRTDSTSGPIVAASGSVLINDTSTTPIPTELTLTGLSSSSYTADPSGLLFITLDSPAQAQQVIDTMFQGTSSVGSTNNRIRLTVTRQVSNGLLTVDYRGFFDASYVSVVSGSTIRVGDWGNFEISNITTFHTGASMAAGSVTNQAITDLTVEAIPFTAPAAPGGIAAPYGGGYYAGSIMVGGNGYYLIVAPKSTGEANRAWKNADTAGPSETYTINDGFAATEAMVAAGNATEYPAAHFCRNLTIGGFTDWYMPSRDELELCFRNFKPGSGSNFIGSRPDTTFQYPEGDDVLVDPNEDGRNANSIPPGDKYTSGFPTQTGSVVFQDPSGSEFFITNFGYLTSSQNDNSSVWMQWFGAGNAGEQVWTSKTIARQVRAVRRVRFF